MRSAVLNKENVSVKLKNFEIKFNNHIPKEINVFYAIKREINTNAQNLKMI